MYVLKLTNVALTQNKATRLYSKFIHCKLLEISYYIVYVSLLSSPDYELVIAGNDSMCIIDRYRWGRL